MVSPVWVDFATGATANPGTKALPKKRWAEAMDVVDSDGTVYIKSDSDEQEDAVKRIAPPSQVGKQSVRTLSVDWASGDPPTLYQRGAIVRSLGNNNFFMQGNQEVWGVTCGHGADSGTGNVSFECATGEVSSLRLRDLEVSHRSTSGSSDLLVGRQGNSTERAALLELIDCDLAFGNASNGFARVVQRMVVRGGKLIDGGAIPDALFMSRASGAMGSVDALGWDLTEIGTGKAVVDVGGNSLGADYLLRQCPIGVGGALCTSSQTAWGASRFEAPACDSAAVPWAYFRKRFDGEEIADTGTYLDAGATYGATGTNFSQRLTMFGNSTPRMPFEGRLCQAGLSDLTSGNLRVEFLTDNVLLTDEVLWVEAYVQESAGTPAGTWLSSRPTNPLQAPVTYPTSTAAWTMTGITTPVKQFIDLPIDPAMDGPIFFNVFCGLSSQTVFYDPKVVKI